MTEPAKAKPSAGSHGRPRLYRTVLALAVASLLAAWLPFSLLYINAVTKHAAAVTHVPAHSVAAGTAQPAQSLTPVTTRVS